MLIRNNTVRRAVPSRLARYNSRATWVVEPSRSGDEKHTETATDSSVRARERQMPHLPDRLHAARRRTRRGQSGARTGGVTGDPDHGNVPHLRTLQQPHRTRGAGGRRLHPCRTARGRKGHNDPLRATGTTPVSADHRENQREHCRGYAGEDAHPAGRVHEGAAGQRNRHHQRSRAAARREVDAVAEGCVPVCVLLARWLRLPVRRGSCHPADPKTDSGTAQGDRSVLRPLRRRVSPGVAGWRHSYGSRRRTLDGEVRGSSHSLADRLGRNPLRAAGAGVVTSAGWKGPSHLHHLQGAALVPAQVRGSSRLQPPRLDLRRGFCGHGDRDSRRRVDTVHRCRQQRSRPDSADHRSSSTAR